ncbi:N-acetylglucosaminyl deacetylase, LmbE family [Formivibrio citricus]|uniref:N-acetylglucosaminyl deacetylase, LmbE family n=1 Tax=Formivibrio citricus TaxID=83765 RepID=A0A1I4WT64_9NEIS|nr:PIG-L family deacetylase [Formivibrio citricus]SFN17001.1 N-acetylglucosaminyl deacetylase, LmbE family [Formivibrio citricus]
MSSPQLDFVKAHAALLNQTSLPAIKTLNGLTPPPRPALAANAPVAMLFSPHPDDECITGALPLRLMREAGYRVVNLPVTLGSNPRRIEEREHELQRACTWLGFDIQEIEPEGLSHINAHARDKEPEAWAEKVEDVAGIIARFKPAIVICPNDDDGHATHIGTHHLVTDALAHENHACWLVQTEFWRAMTHPNLLVESSLKDTADLVTALSCHVGEIKRNPYHLRLTSWMADNVRRGGELIGGAGVQAPDFAFGTLYRMDRFDGEQIVQHKERHVIGAKETLEILFGGV